VVMYTDCISCRRPGRAYENTNYVYECGRCEVDRLDGQIRYATKQIWWIRLLYWLTDRKRPSYKRENVKELAEGFFNEHQT